MLVYSVLAFAISWGAVLLVVGRGGIPIPAEKVQLAGMAMLLGTTVSGLLSTVLVGGRSGVRELWSRLTQWRVGLGWYAFALLTAPLVTAVVLLVLSSFSASFTPNIAASADASSLLVSGIVAGLVVGLFEEIGWTGFAVPQLRRTHGVVATGIIVGILWGAWHFILFWEADTLSGVLPFALLLARLFSWLIAYRLLMVWLYDGSGSLLVTILMHVSLVATTVVIEPPLAGGELLSYILVRAAVFWLLALAIVRSRDSAAERRA